MRFRVPFSVCGRRRVVRGGRPPDDPAAALRTFSCPWAIGSAVAQSPPLLRFFAFERPASGRPVRPAIRSRRPPRGHASPRHHGAMFRFRRVGVLRLAGFRPILAAAPRQRSWDLALRSIDPARGPEDVSIRRYPTCRWKRLPATMVLHRWSATWAVMTARLSGIDPGQPPPGSWDSSPQTSRTRRP